MRAVGVSGRALRKAGYHAVWRGERAWNGVAILSRNGEPILTRTSLPGDPNDKQSRYIEAAVDGILDWLPVSAERQPAAGAEIRLQAEMVFAPARACEKTAGAKSAADPRRRFQCRADGGRHLRDEIMGR